MSKAFFWGLGIITTIIIVIAAIIKLFNWTVFIGGFMIMCYFLISNVVIKTVANNVNLEIEDMEREKQSFPVCWRNINKLIGKQMPGGETLSWDSGFDIQVKSKEYSGNNNKSTRFLAILGRSSDTKQLTLIIYNTKKQDIVDFIPNPSTDQILDLFHDFKPYDKQEQQFGQYGNQGYRNNNYGRRKSSVNISMGDDGNELPSDSQLRSALGRMD